MCQRSQPKLLQLQFPSPPAEWNLACKNVRHLGVPFPTHNGNKPEACTQRSSKEMQPISPRFLLAICILISAVWKPTESSGVRGVS